MRFFTHTATQKTKVIARPIPKVTSFGCAVTMFMILGFTNILNQLGKWKYITITMFFCDTSALESAK
jgi:hypothetical protein